MNVKLIMMLTLGMLPFVGTAMPTKAELEKVAPVVMDLMRPDQEALKAGKKTKSEVAAAALDLVAKADGEAAKLLLTKGAYNLYVRDGDFEKSIETLKSFREIVPDMEPQYLANIIESSLRTISRKNGGQLYRLLDETRTLARYRGELKKLEAQAKKGTNDKTLQLKLAEHYAVIGDWPKALDAFANSSDLKAAAAAKAEKLADAASSPRQSGSNTPTLGSAADYWWNYSVREASEFEKPFRQHAARLYEKVIASGEVVGLNKIQAVRRIEEANALGETLYEFLVAKDGLYCVIDLSGGPNAKNYPVSYLNAVPDGGWSDEYKTTKLVLRRIEPGSFEVLSGKRFSVTKRFYMGVFEVTQDQYERVCGYNPQLKYCLGAKKPVGCAPMEQVRGAVKGLEWPLSDDVDGGTFVANLRRKTALHIDLPTEIQWEYACRAERFGSARNKTMKDDEILKLGRMAVGKDAIDVLADVGSYRPNAWGLYDMYGNVSEMCLDRARNSWNHFQWPEEDKETAIDPKGPAAGDFRIDRGGCAEDRPQECGPVCRRRRDAGTYHPLLGMRLAIHPPFVPSKAVVGARSSDTALVKAKRELEAKIAALAKAKREMEAKIAAQHEEKLYCVIDLSDGPNAKRYPVSYLNSAPKTGWSDECKTTKLVLRKINPGKFVMGDQVHGNEECPPRKVEMTKTYYMGVFEVTQRQWELVMGSRPSYFNNEACYCLRPVEKVSFIEICGGDAQRHFTGKISSRTGLQFDLPTEEEWEYACRAGTKSDFANGRNCQDKDIRDRWRVEASLDDMGRYACNGGWDLDWGPCNNFTWLIKSDPTCAENHGTAFVGSYKPNAWGLYDMHGNVREWVAHACEQNEKGKKMICRGGGWVGFARVCTSHVRGIRHGGVYDWQKLGFVGFRPVFRLEDVERASPSANLAKDKREMAAKQKK